MHGARHKERKTQTIMVSAMPTIGHTVATEVVDGVNAFSRTRHDWRLRLVSASSVARFLHAGQRLDGFVGYLLDRAAVNMILTCGIPAVMTADVFPDLNLPLVCQDDYAIGRMAAIDFLRRGYRHFAAYMYPQDAGFSRRREEGYRDALRQAGFACLVRHATRGRLNAGTLPPEKDVPLTTWLQTLPKPCAVFTVNDYLGYCLLHECHFSGIHVPQDFAVISVDNDFIAQMALPPLSSVDTPGQRIGYQAAEVLAGILDGKAAPRAPILIPPSRLVSRQSSDALAIEDQTVTTALRHIKDYFREPINVKSIHVAAGGTCRRSLERSFRRWIGHGPGAELLRVRIERAKQMLEETDMRMADVAAQCGIGTAHQFAILFRRKTGMTPSAFRRRSRT